LRALVEDPNPPINIGYRSAKETPALAISERVTAGALSAWWRAAFSEIRDVMQSRALDAAGPAGALFSTELFSHEDGEVIAFVPLRQRASTEGRVQSLVIPATELAIAVHEGAHADVDRTYAALGTHVAEHELGIDGRIREYYLVDRFHTPDSTRWRTEIGWPIFAARTHSRG
jgi:effector-binding domain-containing protein